MEYWIVANDPENFGDPIGPFKSKSQARMWLGLNIWLGEALYTIEEREVVTT